jgi:hypothetical protein
MSLPKSLARGDSLIGIIIALGIFLILSQAVITLALSVYDLISYSRARISARHIALESIEIIRNSPYDQVGTVGGIPRASSRRSSKSKETAKATPSAPA